MDGWETKKCTSCSSSTFILLPSQPSLSIFQCESHHQSEQPTGVTLSPHLTSLDPEIFISHLSDSLPLVPPASCWHLFSSLSLFFVTNLYLACPFPHFHSGCTLSTLPTWSLEFLFSFNLCGDFAMSIQAAKFHFNLLSPFTCSGHCTGGWDCSKPILCGLHLALSVALLFFYLYFLSGFCGHFLHFSRS